MLPPISYNKEDYSSVEGINLGHPVYTHPERDANEREPYLYPKLLPNYINYTLY